MRLCIRPKTKGDITTIFTQKVPLSEFKEERSREYDQIVASGKLEDMLEFGSLSEEDTKLLAEEPFQFTLRWFVLSSGADYTCFQDAAMKAVSSEISEEELAARVKIFRN